MHSQTLCAHSQWRRRARARVGGVGGEHFVLDAIYTVGGGGQAPPEPTSSFHHGVRTLTHMVTKLLH